MGIIFDLDQTLIDSSVAAPYRGRDWKKTYSLIPGFKIYKGMEKVHELLSKHKFKVAIVTTSPQVYCSKVVAHWNIPCDYIVGYHDVQRRKPAPDQMIKALKLLECKPSEVLSIGDRIIDIEASKAANITSVGCLWGSTEDLASANPDVLIASPLELTKVIRSFYKIKE